MKSVKLLMAVGCALALAATTTACGGSEDAGSKDSAVVRIATGVDASYAPVYVAAEKGLFDKHGVKVEYITTEGGPAAGQAVIANTADIATLSDGTSVTLMGQDPSLHAFSVMEESSKYIKVVFRKGIKDAGDIKKMSAVPGIIQMATVRFLENEGIDPDAVTMVTATPPDIPTLLQRGDIDAAVIYEPWAGRTAAAGGNITGDIGDFGMKYQQWLLANKDWLADNSESVTKVIAALAEASELIKTDPDEVAKITDEAVQVPADLTMSLLPEITFEQRDLTEADLEQATDTAEFFVDAGGMKAVPDLAGQLNLGWSASNSKN